MVTKVNPTVVDDQVFGRRNRIINGDMRIAQRGTSFTGSEYTLDRFEQVLSGGSATTTQETFALGSEVEGFTKYLKQAVSTGDNYCGIIQRIEDVKSLPQGDVTISFYAKGTNPASGSLELIIFALPDGSTVERTYLDTTITLTSSWQRFTKTFTVPSLSGLSTPTANSQAYIRLSQRASDSGTAAWELNLTGVQLEVGSQATPFEHRSYGEELAMCQRYYQQIDLTAYQRFDASAYADTTSRVYTTPSLPVTLRTTPTVTQTALTVDGANVSSVGNISGTQRMSFVLNHGGSKTANESYQVYPAGSASVGFDAEL